MEETFIFIYRPPEAIKTQLTARGVRCSLTPPKYFNDPFDCSFAFDAAAFEDYWRWLWHEEIMFTDDDINEYATHLPFNYLEDLSAGYGVVCASATPNNTLMWSHYAKNHSGLVVCLNPIDLAGMGLEFKPVRYSKKRPRLKNDIWKTEDGDLSLIESAIFTKSTDWKYEQEMRLLLPLKRSRHYRVSKQTRDESARYYVNFPYWAVDHVIAGWRMGEEDRNRLVKMVARYPDVRLYRAWPNPYEYKMRILPYFSDEDHQAVMRGEIEWYETTNNPPLSRKHPLIQRND